MSRSEVASRARAAAAVRGGWGCVLLFAPGRFAGLGSHRPVPAAAVAVVRVLAVRQIVQAAVTAAAPTAGVATLGASVDALHAGTCLGLAAAWPRWWRPALTDAVIGGALAAVGAGVRR